MAGGQNQTTEPFLMAWFSENVSEKLVAAYFSSLCFKSIPIHMGTNQHWRYFNHTVLYVLRYTYANSYKS